MMFVTRDQTTSTFPTSLTCTIYAILICGFASPSYSKQLTFMSDIIYDISPGQTKAIGPNYAEPDQVINHKPDRYYFDNTILYTNRDEPVRATEHPTSPSSPRTSSESNSTEASPEPRFEKSADDADTKRHKMMEVNGRLEAAYQVLNITDLAETVYCLDRHRCQEANPIFGHHASNGTIIAGKAIGGMIHFATYSLIKDNPKTTRLFEIISIAVQGGVVAWNATICF